MQMNVKLDAEIRTKFDKAVDRIGLVYDPSWAPFMIRLAGAALERYNGIVRVQLSLPIKKISTGYRSQNSRIHGHCSDLADQMVDENGDPLYTMEQVKSAMKRMAVAEGFPTFLNLDGVEEPISLAAANTEHAKILTDTINRFADEHGFYLTEYDEEGKPYMSIGGRTRGEMNK